VAAAIPVGEERPGRERAGADPGARREAEV